MLRVPPSKKLLLVMSVADRRSAGLLDLDMLSYAAVDGGQRGCSERF